MARVARRRSVSAQALALHAGPTRFNANACGRTQNDPPFCGLARAKAQSAEEVTASTATDPLPPLKALSKGRSRMPTTPDRERTRRAARAALLMATTPQIARHRMSLSSWRTTTASTVTSWSARPSTARGRCRQLPPRLLGWMVIIRWPCLRQVRECCLSPCVQIPIRGQPRRRHSWHARPRRSELDHHASQTRSTAGVRLRSRFCAARVCNRHRSQSARTVPARRRSLARHRQGVPTIFTLAKRSERGPTLQCSRHGICCPGLRRRIPRWSTRTPLRLQLPWSVVSRRGSVAAGST